MSVINGAIRPDFIVIGSMKSGTTTLYRYLAAHPDIGMSRDKETDYFVGEKNFGRGPAWYAAQFAPGPRLHGEASPNYTKVDDFPGVPERIKAHNPDVKLIFMVRDPVDRFVSQYRHSWTMGDVRDDPEAMAGTDEYRHILDTSRYARQFEAYLAEFERDRILVVDFDRFVGETDAAMAEIHAFLGVAHRPVAQGSFNDNSEVARVPAVVLRFAQSPLGRLFTHVVSRENRDRVRRLLARGKARQPPAFPPALRARVRDDLRADVARFRTLAGHPFAHWSL